nr:uncharacterized protein LOC105880596 [Microcebus murinus]
MEAGIGFFKTSVREKACDVGTRASTVSWQRSKGGFSLLSESSPSLDPAERRPQGTGHKREIKVPAGVGSASTTDNKQQRSQQLLSTWPWPTQKAVGTLPCPPPCLQPRTVVGTELLNLCFGHISARVNSLCQTPRFTLSVCHDSQSLPPREAVLTVCGLETWCKSLLEIARRAVSATGTPNRAGPRLTFPCLLQEEADLRESLPPSNPCLDAGVCPLLKGTRHAAGTTGLRRAWALEVEGPPRFTVSPRERACSREAAFSDPALPRPERRGIKKHV